MKFHRAALALAIVTASLVPLLAAPATASSDVVFSCFPHGGAETRYSDTWGAARSGGRGHKGTDLMADKGVPVLAVADGEVVGLRSGGLSGYYVHLAHEGGWETYYMHLNNDTAGTDDGRGGPDTAFAPELEVGDTVVAGQHIGFVGDSGNAEGSSPHTHFELHVGGGAVNPYIYLVDIDERMHQLAADVLAVATVSGSVASRLSPALWDRLSEPGILDCLPDAVGDAVEHVFGERPAPATPERWHRIKAL